MEFTNQNIIIFIAATYLIGMATIIHTHNLASSIFFKFVPMMLGLGLALCVFVPTIVK